MAIQYNRLVDSVNRALEFLRYFLIIFIKSTPPLVMFLLTKVELKSFSQKILATHSNAISIFNITGHFSTLNNLSCKGVKLFVKLSVLCSFVYLQILFACIHRFYVQAYLWRGKKMIFAWLPTLQEIIKLQPISTYLNTVLTHHFSRSARYWDQNIQNICLVEGLL